MIHYRKYKNGKGMAIIMDDQAIILSPNDPNDQTTVALIITSDADHIRMMKDEKLTEAASDAEFTSGTLAFSDRMQTFYQLAQMNAMIDQAINSKQ